MVAFLYTGVVGVKCRKGLGEFVTLPKVRVLSLFVYLIYIQFLIASRISMRFCYCISIIVFVAYKMATVTNNFDASIDFCHYLGPASPLLFEGL